MGRGGNRLSKVIAYHSSTREKNVGISTSLISWCGKWWWRSQLTLIPCGVFLQEQLQWMNTKVVLVSFWLLPFNPHTQTSFPACPFNISAPRCWPSLPPLPLPSSLVVSSNPLPLVFIPLWTQNQKFIWNDYSFSSPFCFPQRCQISKEG